MILSADDHAVLAKRSLRIHDASAVRFAWDQHATKGLTPHKRKESRYRNMERAHEFKLDTEEGETGRLKLPIVLNAMSFNIALDDRHPNKMPFHGVFDPNG
jgi:hypothetical protein